MTADRSWASLTRCRYGPSTSSGRYPRPW